MIDDDLDLSPGTAPSPTVPYPRMSGGPRAYFGLTGTVFRHARKEFGLRPFVAVAAEALAVPLLLLAIQAAVLSVASSFNLGDAGTLVALPGIGIGIPVWTAAGIVLVAGGTSGLLSYYARSRINKYAIRFEQACARRAVEFYLGRPDAPNLKEALAIARVDARSCGSALRLLLLSLPWGLALVLIVPLLLWIHWVWTLLLAITSLIAALALLILNRRTVQATRNFDALRDASGLELASLLKGKGQGGRDPAEWQRLHAEYLDAYEHRLQVPVRTQAITTVLFAISLALIVPFIILGGAAKEMHLIVLVFYLILLRVGFGYFGRFATLLMAFNQQYRNVHRFMVTMADTSSARTAKSAGPEDRVRS